MTNSTLPHDHQPQLQLQQKQEQAPVVHKQPQMMKKQTRRRTHASRPYQERLLNMAEARREIVTALKIHRANMRQQPTYQHQESTLLRQSPSLHLQQQQEQQQQQVVFHHDRSQAAAVEEEAAPAPASYAAAASFADHQLCNPLAQWIAAAAAPAGAGSYCYSSPLLLPYDLTPLEAPTPTAAIMGGVDVEWHGLEHLARSLPAQPLGLNLSFHGFGGGFVDASNDGEVLFGGGAPLIQSSSSPAASSHAAYSPIATEAASGALGSPALSSTAEKYSSPVDAPAAAAALTPVAPDDGETRSAGVGLCEEKTAEDVAAASAWWSKILLESVGESGGEVVEGGAAVGCCTAEENVAAAAAGLPAEWRWLCDDGAGAGEQGAATGGDEPPDVVLETMHAADGEYNNCCYQGGHRSDGADDGITALPCMDDIEGWDGEWFSCSS